MPTFPDLGVPAPVARALTDAGITEPFPIQAATLPDALAGHDVAGKAPTGSGKTLAFGIPAVLAASRARAGAKRPPARQPFALILVPTRELAAQVSAAMDPLASALGVRVACFYGGVGYGGQRSALQRGVDIAVACPGRLEDLVAQGDVDLGHVGLAVLDEADRMADMGFLPAVRRLLDATRSDRQTLLFSATLDGDVDVLVKRYQRQPRRHEVALDESDLGDVHHAFWLAPREVRADLTAAIVSAHHPAIVFSRTRHGADRLVKRLARAGVQAAPIHGSRSQPQRDRALASFKAGQVQALVATDVAARGIHVDEVACVIHFDLPADHKDYVHRSGRTARAGADGLVVSLVGSDQRADLESLKRKLGRSEPLTEPDLEALPASALPARPVAETPAPRPEQAPHPKKAYQPKSGQPKSSQQGRRRAPGRGAQGSGNGTPRAGEGRRRRRSGQGRAPSDRQAR